jgi:hypothetical protein
LIDSENLESLKELQKKLKESLDATNFEIVGLYEDLTKKEIEILKDKIEYNDKIKSLNKQSKNLKEDIDNALIEKNKKIEDATPKQDIKSIGLEGVAAEFYSGIEKYRGGKKDISEIMSDYTKQQLKFEEKKAEHEEERIRIDREKNIRELERDSTNTQVLRALEDLIKLIKEPAI